MQTLDEGRRRCAMHCPQPAAGLGLCHTPTTIISCLVIGRNSMQPNVGMLCNSKSYAMHVYTQCAVAARREYGFNLLSRHALLQVKGAVYVVFMYSLSQFCVYTHILFDIQCIVCKWDKQICYRVILHATILRSRCNIDH